MTVKEILTQLGAMGDDARKKHNAKVGPDGISPPADQFGVKMSDVRALAKKIKPDRALALNLWETGNVEAQLLAALIIKPLELSANELDELTRSTTSAQAAEWLNSYVVAQHPDKDSLRMKWMSKKEKDRWASRAGWHLTASCVNKGLNKGLNTGVAESDALDIAALLDRIEKEMPKAAPEVRWTMNNTLMAIGVNHADHRARAIAIGEKIGLYKDWPQSKGCIIPYAPTAIDALVKSKK